MDHHVFNTKQEFMTTLTEIVKRGTPRSKIDIRTPYPVHEAMELLDDSPSKVRMFQGGGAITGFITGFLFTSYTVWSWPMITGGKPFISLPAFTVIAYELTILFGCLGGFLGFLFLSRLPVPQAMFNKDDVISKHFEIHVGGDF